MANFEIFFNEKNHNDKIIGEMKLSVVAENEAAAVNKYIDLLGHFPQLYFLEVNQID